MTETAESGGALFVVGGAGDRSGGRLILREFLEAAGGASARLLVIGTASTTPDDVLAEYRAAFDGLGLGRLHLCAPQTRAEVDEARLLDYLDEATGVYFTGGDQLRLVSTLGGTEFAARLRRRHAEGLALGGTSAGASAMSAVMIGRGRAQGTRRKRST